MPTCFVRSTLLLMSQQQIVNFRLLFLTFSLALLLSVAGCAGFTEKFQPRTTEDVGYFADQTITLLNQADFGFSRDETVYTRDFYDNEGELESRLNSMIDEIDYIFQGIIEYSIELVLIVQTNETNEARIKAYADYLEKASRENERLYAQVRLPKEVYQQVLKKIRAQTNFRDALINAQPILSGLGWYMNNLLNDIKITTDAVAFKMEERIDTRYAEVIQYQKALEKEKYNVLRALSLVYLTYAGDKEAYQKLHKSNIVRDKKILPKNVPNEDGLRKIAEHLQTRLDALENIGEDILPDWEIYRATHNELDQLHAKMMKSIHLMRMLTMVWLNAHQQMAAGKTEPAEWFEWQDLAKKAVDALL